MAVLQTTMMLLWSCPNCVQCIARNTLTRLDVRPHTDTHTLHISSLQQLSEQMPVYQAMHTSEAGKGLKQRKPAYLWQNRQHKDPLPSAPWVQGGGHPGAA